MRSNAPRFLILVLVSASVLWACGGDKAAPEISADEALAKSVLLTLDDFPKGWVELPNRDSGESLTECLTYQGRTARANTENFAPDEDAGTVSLSVLVFDTNANAKRLQDETENALACGVDKLNGGEYDTTRVAVSGAKVEPFDLDRTDADVEAYLNSLDLTGEDFEQRVYTLVVYVVRDRVAYSLQVQSAAAPGSEVKYLVTNLMDLIDRRVADATS